MSAQFFGRSGKVLYGAFSIVGMASQPHNVNKGIPDDRVARSSVAIDRKYGIKITTTSTCCKIVISGQISSRIKRHVELFVAVVAI